MMVSNALCIPDCHVPWHDEKAWDIMLRVAKDFDAKHSHLDQPGLHEIVILGDFLDFFGVSLHEKNELPEYDFFEEVHIGIKMLKELRAKFPKAKITYIEGNHEYRLKRYMWKNAKDLVGFMSVPNLLTLDDLGINWVPYGKYQKYRIFNSNLFARHEPFSNGEHVCAGTIKKGRGASWIFGHTHRVQYSQINDVWMQPIEAISAGWLGLPGSSVVNYIKNHEQWLQSFTFIQVIQDSGVWFHDQVIIKDHQAIWDNKFYASKDPRQLPEGLPKLPDTP